MCTQTPPRWWVRPSFQECPQESLLRGLSPSSHLFLPSLGQETLMFSLAPELFMATS